jgi:hypothetical protein
VHGYSSKKENSYNSTKEENALIKKARVGNRHFTK